MHILYKPQINFVRLNRFAWSTSKNLFVLAQKKKKGKERTKAKSWMESSSCTSEKKWALWNKRTHSPLMIKKSLLRSLRKTCSRNRTPGAVLVLLLSAGQVPVIQVTAAWGAALTHASLHTFTCLWHWCKFRTCTSGISFSPLLSWPPPNFHYFFFFSWLHQEFLFRAACFSKN